MTQNTRWTVVAALVFLAGFTGCGPELSVPEGAEGTEPTQQTEQQITCPYGCIGGVTPLWRKTGVFVGPCQNGATLNKGSVALKTENYIVGTYWKKAWDNLDGYTHVERYVQASYSTAKKVWVCEASRYVEYGYPETYVHRHKDNFYTCYGAACQYLGVLYSKWYPNHTCDH